MNRKCLFLMIALIISLSVFILSGCEVLPRINGSSEISAGKITPPHRASGPFEGKWEITEELMEGSGGGDGKKQWKGEFVQFSGDLVAFYDTVWENTSYKIKRVSAPDFVATRNILSDDFPDVSMKKIDVITIYASGNYLGEFLRINDERMIFFIGDNELMLVKISDKADNLSDISTANINSISTNIAQAGSSGVLLGLRIPEGVGYTYRTLWIASSDDEIHPILISDDIFFPRTSGFWELKVRDADSGDGGGNILMTRNVLVKEVLMEGGGDDNEKNYKNKDYKTRYRDDISVKTGREMNDYINAKLVDDVSEKTINYIGNDYISIEKNITGYMSLMVLPVDKPSSEWEISIVNLLGENGRDTLLSQREKVIETLRSNENAGIISGAGTAHSFGIARQNGHWQLVGRVNYLKDGTIKHRDFNLKIMPPANLIFYDTLGLSWYKIKDRVPDAQDAFTSPDKDFALVKTRNKLMIFKIGPGQLSELPLAELEFEEGTEVIMAEWALGSYVKNWEESFLSYGARLLDSSSIDEI